MRNHFRKIAFIFVVMLILVGCKSNSSEGSSNSGDVKQHTNIDHTPITIIDKSGDPIAEVTLDSWSYLPEGVYVLPGQGNTKFYEDLQSGIVLTYTYTNYIDEPRMFQEYYGIYAYQNGRELKSMYEAKSLPRRNGTYAPLDDWHERVMDGGAITIAQDFYLSDNSPITLIIRHDYRGANDDEEVRITFDLE